MVLRTSLVFGVLLVACAAESLAGEVRTYRFVGDAPTYHTGYGECVVLPGQPFAVRARVEGTFQVELDFEDGVGTLLSLDARVTGREALMADLLWQPYGSDHNLHGPHTLYDRFRVPVVGNVMSVPAGGWSFQCGSSEYMTIDLRAPSADGGLPFPSDYTSIGLRVAVNYDIYFEDREAVFSYDSSITNWTQSIIAARAVLVPEPAAIALGIVGMGMICTFFRRRRRPCHRAD